MEPVGAIDPTESIDWPPRPYRSKFGPIRLPTRAWTPGRGVAAKRKKTPDLIPGGHPWPSSPQTQDAQDRQAPTGHTRHAPQWTMHADQDSGRGYPKRGRLLPDSPGPRPLPGKVPRPSNGPRLLQQPAPTRPTPRTDLRHPTQPPQSAGPTYEAPDISLDETISTGAGAGDRGRSVSQSLAGSCRKTTRGRRPKLVPIDEQADAKGAGPSKAGNKAAEEDSLGLMDGPGGQLREWRGASL